MKSTKIDLKKKSYKNLKKHSQKKSKTLWITIAIHSAIGRTLFSLISFNFCYFIKFNNIVFL